MFEPTVKKKRPISLIVLCLLTILGNLILILKGIITYYVLDNSSSDRREEAIVLIDMFFTLELVSCGGSILGAIIMLYGKRLGLILYQISSVVYILITLLLTMLSMLSIVGIPLAFLQIVYLIPSILFFIWYRNYAKYLS